MCGLAGVIGFHLKQAEINFFRQLIYVTGLRGQDATGVLVGEAQVKGVKQKEDLYLCKEACSVSKFLELDAEKKTQALIGGSIWDNLYMGHCRAATVGKLDVASAHPFEHGDLVGFHNGTLIDAKYRNYNKKGNVRSDSDLLFEDMSERGIISVLEELSRYSAYAVAIYKRKSGIVYLARNEERTLFIAKPKDSTALYYASEAGMIRFVAARCGIELEWVRYLNPNTLFTVDMEEIRIGNPKPYTTVPLKVSPLKHRVWPTDNVPWEEYEDVDLSTERQSRDMGTEAPPPVRNTLKQTDKKWWEKQLPPEVKTKGKIIDMNGEPYNPKGIEGTDAYSYQPGNE